MSGVGLVDLAAFAAFFAAALVLDWISISLPRGDEVAVSGAVIVGAALCIGFGEAIVLGLLSLGAVRLLSHLKHHDVSIGALLVRCGSMLSAWIAARVLLTLDLPLGEAVAALGVPAVYLLVELVGRQLIVATRTGREVSRLVAGNLRRSTLLIAAQSCSAALIVVTYGSMRAWSLVPVVPLLVLIRQSYSLLLEVRETYRTTVGVLIEAAESGDEAWRGHAERTAKIARAIGTRCGLNSHELDTLGYASLLHDIDHIAVDANSGLMEKGSAAAMLTDVTFLAAVVPVLRVVDGGPTVVHVVERDCLMGFIVALASDIDVLGNGALGLSHPHAESRRISGAVPARLKAKAVSSAIQLGLSVPAID